MYFKNTSKEVRAHLDAVGLQHVTMHVTEWFPCILCNKQDTAQGAAAFSGTLATFLESGVTLATLWVIVLLGATSHLPLFSFHVLYYP